MKENYSYKFSIIIPTYNRNKELIYLLNDLKRQTFTNFEVIVVDDFPSNEPIDISCYSNLKYIKNEKNLGAAESRNIGARIANGEWLVFLDDDDRFDHDKLNKLNEQIIANNCNFIYHPIKWIMVNENCDYITKPEKNTNELSFKKMLSQNQIGGTPGYSIQKDIFWSLGGFNKSLKALEDYDLLLKLVGLKNFKPIYIDIPLTVSYCYTKRASVSKNIKNTINAWNVLSDIYAKGPSQRRNFESNKLKMLAYAETVNLNRKAGIYYLKLFFYDRHISNFFAGIIGLISPKLLIKIRSSIS